LQPFRVVLKSAAFFETGEGAFNLFYQLDNLFRVSRHFESLVFVLRAEIVASELVGFLFLPEFVHITSGPLEG
jgi:hypothetical protein